MEHDAFVEAKKKELRPIIKEICQHYNANSINITAGCNLTTNNNWCEITKLSFYK